MKKSDNDIPAIIPIKDGPLRVVGLKEIEAEGGPIETDDEIALCRCGLSKNKPFCDGAHVAGGFKDDRPENEDDERLTFPGDPITFYENVAICSHAGFCQSGMPDKWREDGKFTDEELAQHVRKCPSGALSYAVGETEHRDHDRPIKMRLKKDGPLEIEGGIDLHNTKWGEGASKEHFALCRCGASKMKPFCDGTHDEVWERGEDDYEPKKNVHEGKDTEMEPHVAFIHRLAREGLENMGKEGPLGAMGVPRTDLPSWDQIQIMTAQLDPRPLTEEDEVSSELSDWTRDQKAASPQHASLCIGHELWSDFRRNQNRSLQRSRKSRHRNLLG